MMNELPKAGEVWWLGDMVVLVLAVDGLSGSSGFTVKGVVLLDIDDVFDPGEEAVWCVDKPGIHDSELLEPNRRIS